MSSIVIEQEQSAVQLSFELHRNASLGLLRLSKATIASVSEPEDPSSELFSEFSFKPGTAEACADKNSPSQPTSNSKSAVINRKTEAAKSSLQFYARLKRRMHLIRSSFPTQTDRGIPSRQRRIQLLAILSRIHSEHSDASELSSASDSVFKVAAQVN